jgi:hypothetical protein
LTSSDAIKIEFTYQEEFAIYVAKTYANNVEFVEKMILDSQALRWCLLDIYNWFVKNKGMAKFETLDEATISKLNGSYEQVSVCLWILNFIFETYFVL